MATPSFTGIPNDTPENMIAEIQKRLDWIMSRLDSKNVKKLDTNETTIKSKNGETYINGPILEMRDSNNTLRLKQGYNSATNTFVYALYNSSGNETYGVDSNGNGVFSGSIVSSIITGGTIRTAASGRRIEIVSDPLSAYAACITLYHDDYAMDMYIGNRDSGVDGYVGVISPVDTDLYIGEFTGTVGAFVKPIGNWDFVNATIYNLVTDTTGNHDHTLYVYNAGQHNHGITDGTVLLTDTGSVIWVESGDHVHTYDMDVAGNHSHSVGG